MIGTGAEKRRRRDSAGTQWRGGQVSERENLKLKIVMFIGKT